MRRQLGNRPALDGVRAIAIVAVMGLHADDRLFRGGFFGVDVFFTLSAFLITTLIVQELDDRDGRYDFRSFYARRALRLGPALVLWLLLLAGPTAAAIGEADRIPVSTLVSIFYVGDFAGVLGADVSDAHAHVWSLAIEEQFYFVWPALLVWLWTRRTADRTRLLIAAVPTAIVVHFAMGQLVGDRNYVLPTGHLVPLAVGCLAAQLFAYAPPETRIVAIVRRPAIAGAALIVLVVLVCGYRPVTPGPGTGSSSWRRWPRARSSFTYRKAGIHRCGAS